MTIPLTVEDLQSILLDKKRKWRIWIFCNKNFCQAGTQGRAWGCSIHSIEDSLARLSPPRLWPGVGWELKDIYVLTNMLTLCDSWYLKLLESVEFNKWFYVYQDGGRVKASSLHINRPENLSTFKENKFWCHILPFSPRQETNKDQASPSFPYFYIQLQITGREVQSIIVK